MDGFEYPIGSSVWLPSADCVWESATVIAHLSRNQLRVRTSDEPRREKVVNLAKCYPRNDVWKTTTSPDQPAQSSSSLVHRGQRRGGEADVTADVTDATDVTDEEDSPELRISDLAHLVYLRDNINRKGSLLPRTLLCYIM